MRQSFKLPKHELTSELEFFIRLTEKDPLLEPQDHVRTTLSNYTINKKLKYQKATDINHTTVLQRHLLAKQSNPLLKQGEKHTKKAKLQLFTQLILAAKKKKTMIKENILHVISFLQIWIESKLLIFTDIQKKIVSIVPELQQFVITSQTQQKILLQTIGIYYKALFKFRKNSLQNLKKITRNIWLQIFKYKKRAKKHLQKIVSLKNLNSYKNTKSSLVFINLNFSESHAEI